MNEAAPGLETVREALLRSLSDVCGWPPVDSQEYTSVGPRPAWAFVERRLGAIQVKFRVAPPYAVAGAVRSRLQDAGVHAELRPVHGESGDPRLWVHLAGPAELAHLRSELAVLRRDYQRRIGAEPWGVEVGEALSRAERMRRYGGAKHGGIEPSATSPNVFLYSDPSRGTAYGYNYDGWSSGGSIFLYTGDGREGEQQLRDGNRAILEHAKAGRALRLFVADGVTPGSSAKIQRYIGEFELDDTLPYTRAEAPDVKGVERSVLVFRLRPVGKVLRREVDRSTSGDVTFHGVAEPVELDREAALVELEAHRTSIYGTRGSEATLAQRRESELVQRYRHHLEALNHVVRRYRVRPPGELRDLLTDLYDETAKELYEAKGVTTRDAVRRAVGQLLDYRRHVPASRLAVLLPCRPSNDLLDLLHGLGVACVFEQSGEGFRRLDP